MRSVKFLFSFNFSLFNQNAFSTTNKHSATRAPTDTHTPCQQIQNHATFSVFHVFLFLFNALFDFVCCCFSNYNFFHLFVICILFSSKCERKFLSPIECFDWPTTTTNKNRWKNIYKNKNWWLDFDLFTQSWFIWCGSWKNSAAALWKKTNAEWTKISASVIVVELMNWTQL